MEHFGKWMQRLCIYASKDSQQGPQHSDLDTHQRNAAAETARVYATVWCTRYWFSSFLVCFVSVCVLKLLALYSLAIRDVKCCIFALLLFTSIRVTYCGHAFPHCGVRELKGLYGAGLLITECAPAGL